MVEPPPRALFSPPARSRQPPMPLPHNLTWLLERTAEGGASSETSDLGHKQPRDPNFIAASTHGRSGRDGLSNDSGETNSSEAATP